MEEHLAECESHLQEKTGEVEALQKEVTFTELLYFSQLACILLSTW